VGLRFSKNFVGVLDKALLLCYTVYVNKHTKRVGVVITLVYVTGDTHSYIDVDKITPSRWIDGRNLTKNDYLIICGDFGFIWNESWIDQWWLKWFERQPWTTLFVVGNHDNFSLIEKYPIVDFLGGKAHKINDSVYNLKIGEMFTIEGKRFFCFGKAQSHDKWHRTKGVDWWEEEMPSEQEYIHGLDTLDRYGCQCDYIITHCAPDSVVDALSKGEYEHDKLTNYFEVMQDRVKFDTWFFGHYHMDKHFTVNRRNYECLYQKVERLL